jgi:hypothetical protein
VPNDGSTLVRNVFRVIQRGATDSRHTGLKITRPHRANVTDASREIPNDYHSSPALRDKRIAAMMTSGTITHAA